MFELLRRLLGLVSIDDVRSKDIEVEKAKTINQKMESIEELATLNKKFKIIIERGELEIVIKDITDITKGK